MSGSHVPAYLHAELSHQGQPPPAAGVPALQAGDENARENAAVRELLLALSVGFTLPGPLPADLQRKIDAGEVGSLDALVRSAEDSGFLTPGGIVAGPLQHEVLAAAPVARIHAMQRELVSAYEASGEPLGEVARQLARGGLADPRVAAELEQAGDRALEHHPALAYQLYDEALLAGADGLATAARRAQAAAGNGDLDGAARIIDTLLLADDPPDLRRGSDVAAAVWAQRGMLARGADVYSWLGASRIGASAPLAAIALIGSGDRAGADALFPPDLPPASPTLLAAALAMAGRGVVETLAPDPQPGLPTLIHASDLLNAAGATLPLPETPAALAALVALHSGEPHTAESVCRSAAAAGQGGDAAKPRLFLLQAWSAMEQDRLEDARLAINEAAKANHWPLDPRDEFLCSALEVGLARRNGDMPRLSGAWDRAREAMLHVSVDLYSLLAWAELAAAAAGLQETRALLPYLEEADRLLDRLDRPPLWSLPLDAARASRNGGKPGALPADHEDVAGMLSWATGMQPQESPARTAGPASAAAPAGPAEGGNGAGPGGSGLTRSGPNEPGLSEREKEVARLVLQGKTYREIGRTIYISPRTAEHHIARMRRRLGAENRSDLLARLRLALDGENPPEE